MNPQPLHERKFEDLAVSIYESNQEVGQAAAAEASEIIQRAIQEKGQANIIVATGNSQLSFLAALREEKGIDWSKVNVFHMDEYVGIDPGHPASFPGFLHRHLVDQVRPKAFYPVAAPVDGQEAACKAYEESLRAHPADLCALGIGENGHLAFNDPPFANFDDPVWVKVVKLDDLSRQQQVGEGHFASIQEVPTHAVTLTIPALLAARRVLAIVPERRKAEAVFEALKGPISPDCPASILRKTAHAQLFLDAESAAKVYPTTG
jgi:glucosamine-6-phosphate deaminase